jgi:hypothetical protein
LTRVEQSARNESPHGASDEAGQTTLGDRAIAIVGGGPAGLVAAIALARRGVRTTVFERDVHPDEAPRFNPDRSYTIDITGHGLRALRYIDATSYFDDRMLAFNGIQYHGRVLEGWDEPGWTGSRGDIVRTLIAVATDRHEGDVDFRFGCPVQSVDVNTGTLTCASPRGGVSETHFDLVIGADGAGSVIRRAMQEQVEGFTVERESIPNHVTMIALDGVGDRWIGPTCTRCRSATSTSPAPSSATTGRSQLAGSARSVRRRSWTSHRSRRRESSSARPAQRSLS